MAKLNRPLKLFSLFAMAGIIIMVLSVSLGLGKTANINNSNSSELFTHPVLKYSVKIPKGWRVSVEPVNSINAYQSVFFLSPENKRVEEQGQSYEISGGDFSISILNSAEDIDSTLNGLYAMYGNHEAIKVGEKDIIKIDNCGHNDQTLCYYLINNNNLYGLSYSQPDVEIRGSLYKDKYLAEFNEFTKSLSFSEE
jgi:ABC-type antimicrobial peptide transport system permease subunit